MTARERSDKPLLWINVAGLPRLGQGGRRRHHMAAVKTPIV